MLLVYQIPISTFAHGINDTQSNIGPDVEADATDETTTEEIVINTEEATTGETVTGTEKETTEETTVTTEKTDNSTELSTDISENEAVKTEKTTEVGAEHAISLNASKSTTISDYMKVVVTHYYYKGERTGKYALLIDSKNTTWDLSYSYNWYVINDNMTITKPIKVKGNINLIIRDSCSFKATKGIDLGNPGEGNSLTIWGQGKSDGKVTVTGDATGAGIEVNSGNALTINGATIVATGKREATGYDGTGGAGIGGAANQSVGDITINAGTVTATGDGGGAGIGSGYDGGGGKVTINGGTVRGTGSRGAAGIGGGRAYNTTGTTVTINGGNVTATGKVGGAGIGGGIGRPCGATTINGGTVTAVGGEHSQGGGAGIGGGGRANAANIKITGGFITATGGRYGAAGIGGGGMSGKLSNFSITGGWIIATGKPTESGTGSPNAIGGGVYMAKTNLSNVTGAVIFDGVTKKGQVYGKHVMSDNRQVPRGYTLEIPVGSWLETGSYKLTNNGTIISGVRMYANEGIFEGQKTIYDNTYKYQNSVTKFESLKIPTLTRAGCKFLGWYDNKEGTGNAVKEIPKNTYNPKEYYAKWELPVTITKQPQDKTVVYGYKNGTISLETTKAEFSKNNDTTYQWYQVSGKGTDSKIENATSNRFSIPNGLSVGTYTYYCKIIHNGYTVDSNRINLKVLQTGVTFENGVQVYGNEVGAETKKNFIFGDTMVVKVTPKLTGKPVQSVFTVNSAVRRSQSENQIAIFSGDTQLTEAQNVTMGQTLTFSINTLDENLLPDMNGLAKEYTITARYLGNGNMAGYSESTVVTVGWLTDAPDAVLSGEQGSNDWYTSEVKFIAPKDYTIDFDYHNISKSDVTFSEDVEREVTYYLKNGQGQIARKSVNIKEDKELPEFSESYAEYTLTTANVEITMEDSVSGIADYEVQCTYKDADVGDPQIQNHNDGTFSVSGLKAGSAYVFLVTATNNAGKSNSVVVWITTPERNLQDAQITLSGDSFVYDGTAKTPKVRLKFSDGTVANEDMYQIHYHNTNGGAGNHTSAGTVTITVTAVSGSKYFGTAANLPTFEIHPKELSVQSVSAQNRTYDGTNHVKVTGVLLEGVENRDQGNVNVDIKDLTGTIDDKKAGTYMGLMLPEQLDLVGKNASNYVLAKHSGKIMITDGVTISKAKGVATITINDWIYSPDNRNANAPVAVSKTNGLGSVQYLYKAQGAEDSTYAPSLPSQAGDYTVKAVFEQTENYQQAVATADFTIEKARPDSMPEDTIIAPQMALTLNDVLLPEGWSWEKGEIKLAQGLTIYQKAIYKDRFNYTPSEVTIEVINKEQSGTTEQGTTSGGGTESGTTEQGTASGSRTESGTTEQGTASGGGTESGTTEQRTTSGGETGSEVTTERSTDQSKQQSDSSSTKMAGTTKKTAKTSDDANIILYIILLMLFGNCTAILVYIKGKKNRH